MTDIKFTNPHEEYCFNNAAYFTACRGNRIQQTFKQQISSVNRSLVFDF